MEDVERQILHHLDDHAVERLAELPVVFEREDAVLGVGDGQENAGGAALAGGAGVIGLAARDRSEPVQQLLRRFALQPGDFVLRGELFRNVPGVENRFNEMLRAAKPVADQFEGAELRRKRRGVDARFPRVREVAHHLDQVRAVAGVELERPAGVGFRTLSFESEMMPQGERRTVGHLAPQHSVEPFARRHLLLAGESGRSGGKEKGAALDHPRSLLSGDCDGKRRPRQRGL